jgi:predicted aspartyl protease
LDSSRTPASAGTSGLASTVQNPEPIASEPVPLASLRWPAGTQVIRFEDLEGAILLPAKLVTDSGRDTSGVFVLDTGAGFLALDLDLARELGIADRGVKSAAVDLAVRPLARFQLGGLQMDQVSPVLTIDAGVIRRATGRPVLGLLGQALISGRRVLLDYREGCLVLLPPGGDSTELVRGSCPGLSADAVAVPFRLGGDGKVLVSAWVKTRVGLPAKRITLIVDTGATKSVLFRAALEKRLPGWTAWPSLRGLGAPTLAGEAPARLVRVPGIELRGPGGNVGRHGMDAAVLEGGLGEVLEADVGEPLDGLLGYSFLKHYRVALDFPRGLLWLDPSRGDVRDRPDEYSHPGLQLETAEGRIRVVAVAAGSPAEQGGVRALDEVVAIDGRLVPGSDVVAVARELEGTPGTVIRLRIRRGSREWTCRLVRRRLL